MADGNVLGADKLSRAKRMIRITILSGLLTAATTGLLAADDIPGWTELSNLAKASVVGFLCLLLGAVVLLLLKTLRDQQKLHIQSLQVQHSEFIAEVQSARRDYGEVVKTVCNTNDARYATLHVDLQDAIKAVSGLSIQCAQAQATAAALRRSEWEENQAQHRSEREGNAKSGQEG